MDSTLFGELMAFTTTISWTICVFPFTAAARRLGPAPLNHFRLLLAVLILTGGAFFLANLSPQELIAKTNNSIWLWFGLSGILGLALGDYFAFTAFAILGPRFATLFTTLSPAASLLFGFFLVHERINPIGLAGIAVTISGIMWLSLSKEEKERIDPAKFGSYKKGIIFGLLSAMCQGGGIALANRGFFENQDMHISPIHATWIRMVSGTTAVFVITILSGRIAAIAGPIIRNEGKGLPYAVMGTLFGPVIGVSFSMLAISSLKDQPSIAQTIFSLLPVFTLPVAAILFKEKISSKSLVGVAIAIAGVFLLIWREEIWIRIIGQ